MVDSVVTEIDKLKPVSGEKADKLFVELVEKLEKVERDLRSENLLNEIMNGAIIGKLESKLPVVIKNKWAELNIEEDLDQKSSEERFKRLMNFLDQQKRIVEFQSGEARQSSGNKSSSYCMGQAFLVETSGGESMGSGDTGLS